MTEPFSQIFIIECGAVESTPIVPNSCSRLLTNCGLAETLAQAALTYVVLVPPLKANLQIMIFRNDRAKLLEQLFRL